MTLVTFGVELWRVSLPWGGGFTPTRRVGPDVTAVAILCTGLKFRILQPDAKFGKILEKFHKLLPPKGGNFKKSFYFWLANSICNTYLYSEGTKCPNVTQLKS